MRGAIQRQDCLPGFQPELLHALRGHQDPLLFSPLGVRVGIQQAAEDGDKVVRGPLRELHGEKLHVLVLAVIRE